jgi:hypothetical protein
MGFAARGFTAAEARNEQDAAGLPRLAPIPPVHGFVVHNGRAIAYTLDVAAAVPEQSRVVPEQLAIAAIMVFSFMGAICHLVG